VEPLRVHYEEPGAGGTLPEPLASLYGGGLGLAEDVVYASFIGSLDGVAALEERRGSGRALRGDCDADRFVMALLRLRADVLLVGAGTLRADHSHLWGPAHIDHERAPIYEAMGRPALRVAVVTASGDLGQNSPALEAGVLVLTTDSGAGRLRGHLPSASTVRSLGAGIPTAAAIVAALRAEGHRRVLTEGGPTLLGQLLAEDQLDELFITLSPVLAGRQPGDGRLSLAEGHHLLPPPGRWAHLRSLRQSGSHLFLRYALR
jgi:riboflavin biosynthesis pyrimidine reductase